MIWKLQVEIDADEFKPGEWFVGLRLIRGCYQQTFNNIVALAEEQVDGFTWTSWQQ